MVGRTQGKQEVRKQEESEQEMGKQEMIALLWEGVGACCLVVKVPFSLMDLEAWARQADSYREDPERVVQVCETILKTRTQTGGISKS